jgi:hypothetical protein
MVTSDMSEYLQGFFADRTFGLLAVISLAVAVWLSWNAAREFRELSRQRRQRLQKSTRYNSGDGLILSESKAATTLPIAD